MTTMEQLLIEIDRTVARLEDDFLYNDILDAIEEYLVLADEFEPLR